MSEESRKRLENLRELTDADSFGEVIRRALSVYEYLWQESSSGEQVVLKGPKGERELVLK